LTPNTGWVGTTTTITITSTTFPIEGDYQILWSSNSKFNDGKTIVLKEGTSPRGNYTVVESVTIPEAPFGTYYVGFIRLGYTEPTIFSFNVLPRLRVQPPASGSPGATVTAYGTGFPVNDAVSLTFDSKPINTSIIANDTGSFVIDFTVPNTPAALHQLGASSSKMTTNVAPAILMVIPSITVDPKNPQTGAKVTVTGGGFAANSTISIKYNDYTMTNSPATDDTGNLTYSFTLPQSSENGYRFVATDQAGNTATLNTTTGGNTPPPSSPPPSTPPQPPPTPETPKPSTVVIPRPTAVEPKGQRFGLFGTQPVNFIWSQVSAFGGITYTLEVADNYKFSAIKPGMSATELTQTNYTLKLEPGTYYWRVKAVDISGHESEWAYSLYNFNVGLPGWIPIAAVVIYIIIFYLIVRALLRRQRRRPYYY
jgi:hypothetical protein